MHSVATDIVLLLGVGVASQLIANVLGIPSILLLLLSGLLLGPIFHILVPDQIFGSLVFPLTSLGVALILFEGGLGLKFKDLPKVGKIVRNLTLLAPIATCLGASLAAHLILDFPPGLALLLGALLVVTGPTVVQPLLRNVKVAPDVAAALRWESLLTDPLGAVLAVLVFESLGHGGFSALPAISALGLLKLTAVGFLLGLLFGALIVAVIRLPWVPGYLENPITLFLVLLASVISNAVQPEAGLLTVTVMGMFLANQRYVTIQHIVLFKENLGVLLLSLLFVTLAARMDLNRVMALFPQGLWFVAALIFIVRPFAIAVASVGAKMPLKNLVFMAGMAPRGIVAAAVSALLAHELIALQYPRAEEFAPLMFLTIIGTVLWYSATARLLVRLTGTGDQSQSGVVFIGAHRWARRIAAALKDLGVNVFLIDTNEINVMLAGRENLFAFHGSVLSEECRERLAEGNYHTLLALTPNDEVNSLAALQFAELEREAHVYKVAAPGTYDQLKSPVSAYVRIKPFGGKDLPYELISDYFSRGAKLETRKAESGAVLAAADGEIPLVGITSAKEIVVYSGTASVSDKKLSALLVLVPPSVQGAS